MTQTYYVGLDVHKETISIAHALQGDWLARGIGGGLFA